MGILRDSYKVLYDNQVLVTNAEKELADQSINTAAMAVILASTENTDASQAEADRLSEESAVKMLKYEEEKAKEV